MYVSLYGYVCVPIYLEPYLDPYVDRALDPVWIPKCINIWILSFCSMVDVYMDPYFGALHGPYMAPCVYIGVGPDMCP